MTYLTQTANSSFAFGARIAAMRDALAERWVNYKVFKTTQRELEMLSNRELADLGLNRSMIKGIALEAAYGK